mmetsp:Transcript_53224/g.169011  ORF Transcript_53224/g.169011 Transcript_53224/m.169011 type:complete len:240 (-) Transcript_53224:225-944(-)
MGAARGHGTGPGGQARRWEGEGIGRGRVGDGSHSEGAVHHRVKVGELVPMVVKLLCSHRHRHRGFQLHARSPHPSDLAVSLHPPLTVLACRSLAVDAYCEGGGAVGRPHVVALACCGPRRHSQEDRHLGVLVARLLRGRRDCDGYPRRSARRQRNLGVLLELQPEGGPLGGSRSKQVYPHGRGAPPCRGAAHVMTVVELCEALDARAVAAPEGRVGTAPPVPAHRLCHGPRPPLCRGQG